MQHPGAEPLVQIAREHGEILKHVLGCSRCKDLLVNLLYTDEETGTLLVDGTDEPSDLLSSFARRVLERSIEILKENDTRRAAARVRAKPLFDELLALPPEMRQDAVDSGARFRTFEVGDLLLSAAQEAFDNDPLGANHFAALAVAVFERLSPEAASVRGALASSYCLLGDTERLRGRLGLAEDFLETAVRQLQDDLLDSEPRARLCRALGEMRKEQGRADEAVALLGRARALAASLGDAEELASAHLSLGWLFLDEFETPAALELLQEAARLARAQAHPHRLLAALHGLALGYAELGEGSKVEEVRHELGLLKPRLPGPQDEIRVAWIGAQADFRLGEKAKARETLQSVFHGFLEADSVFNAAAVALELAYHCLHDSEASSDPLIEKLAEDLAVPGRLPGQLADVVDFALRFPLRNNRRGFYLDVLHSAGAYVGKVRFNPELPFYPLQEPERVLLWAELSPVQRRRAAATSQVQLDEHHEPRTTRDGRLIGWTHEALTGVRIEFPGGAGTDLEDTWFPA